MKPFLNDRAKQSLVALAVMLLAAAVGVILNWSWWLAYAVIAPSAAWLIVSGKLVVYRQLGQRPGPSDRRVPVLLVVPVMLAAAIEPTRYSGLIVVVAFAVVYVFSKRVEHALASPSQETPSG
jgi:hypothetical protein